jgi:hypothetical protein
MARKNIIIPLNDKKCAFELYNNSSYANKLFSNKIYIEDYSLIDTIDDINKTSKISKFNKFKNIYLRKPTISSG